MYQIFNINFTSLQTADKFWSSIILSSIFVLLVSKRIRNPIHIMLSRNHTLFDLKHAMSMSVTLAM